MVLLDGEDVTEAIRHPEVTRAVSAVSSLREVREAMVREQRALGKDGGIVLEGRDIGTVVFPDADLKFFMVAGIAARARRRQEELAANGDRRSRWSAGPGDCRNAIARDSTRRSIAPAQRR